uniref:HELP domain-containing protein n=1 Tax=Macrostomum lignano TaxID=282301 RepID=A0A1I8HUF2_9PLAT
GLLTQENSELRDRVADLEHRVQAQSDELTCLKSSLSDCLRRLATLESSRGGPHYHVPVHNYHGAVMHASHCSTELMALQSQASPNFASAKSPSVAPSGGPSFSKKSAPAATAAGGGATRASAAGRRTTGSGGGGHTVSYGPPPAKHPASRQSAKEQPLHVSVSQSAGNKEPVWVKEEGILRIYLRGRAVNLYAPSDIGDQLSAKEIGEAPNTQLKLEWVYGYRGRDCRSNLYHLPTGELVYFVASVVVLHNVEEGTQRHYTGHNDDVKCLAVHPDRITMASGQVAGHDKKQGKPHVRIWSSVDLTTLHVLGLGDFERAVSCLAFSRADGGTHLCVVDDANEHAISVWDWSRGHKLTETKTSTEPVLACECHPLDAGVIITCGKNQLAFWTLEGSRQAEVRALPDILPKRRSDHGRLERQHPGVARGSNRIGQAVTGAHEGGIFSLCAMKDDKLVSGGRDRRLVQWDSAYNRTGAEATVPEQYGPIRTLAQGPGNALLVGTTRNCILQGALDLAASLTPIVSGHSDELWGLASHPSQLQFATAGSDRLVTVWDALTHQTVWSREITDQGHCLAFHPSGETLAVGCQNGRWYVLDAQRCGDIAAVHTDGSEQIECLEFSPDGSMLALGSRDNSIYVFACTEAGRKYSRIGRCCGHSSFITHLDWSADCVHLRSNSGDYELLFWTAANCRQVSSPSSLRDSEWASQRCAISFDTAGVWPEGADGTDINASDRSFDRQLVATGDDFGQVCLYRYPCFQPRSKGHAAAGHSSHVTNVRFLRDSSRLLSTGGKDTAVLQWEIA